MIAVISSHRLNEYTTCVNGPEDRVANVTVDGEEDGLYEAEYEELERVDLAQQHAEGDQYRCRAQPALQNSTATMVNL